jgi:hypothetical protein
MLNGTRQRLLVYHVVMASRKPKGIVDDIYKGVTNIVSPWLGTPPGELKQVTQFKQATRVAAETLDQTVAGGMVKAGTQGNKALAKQAAVNAAALATGYVAGKAIQTAAGAAAAKINPFREATKQVNKISGWVSGQASAEDLMKLRSIDRYQFSAEGIKTPPRIIKDTEHLTKIRKQNINAYEYENRVRLYSDDDLSKYSNLYDDIKDRGIQSPVNIGRVQGKPTLMEGNHRVIAQFDINPKTKIPFQVSQQTWNEIDSTSKALSRQKRFKRR